MLSFKKIITEFINELVDDNIPGRCFKLSCQSKAIVDECLTQIKNIHYPNTITIAREKETIIKIYFKPIIDVYKQNSGQNNIPPSRELKKLEMNGDCGIVLRLY